MHSIFAQVSTLELASALTMEKLGLLADGQTPDVQRQAKEAAPQPRTRSEQQAGTNTLLALKARVSVSQEGLDSLHPGTWLSDEIINYGFQAIIAQHAPDT